MCSISKLLFPFSIPVSFPFHIPCRCLISDLGSLVSQSHVGSHLNSRKTKLSRDLTRVLDLTVRGIVVLLGRPIFRPYGLWTIVGDLRQNSEHESQVVRSYKKSWTESRGVTTRHNPSLSLLTSQVDRVLSVRGPLMTSFFPNRTGISVTERLGERSSILNGIHYSEVSLCLCHDRNLHWLLKIAEKRRGLSSRQDGNQKKIDEEKKRWQSSVRDDSTRRLRMTVKAEVFFFFFLNIS